MAGELTTTTSYEIALSGGGLVRWIGSQRERGWRVQLRSEVLSDEEVEELIDALHLLLAQRRNHAAEGVAT